MILIFWTELVFTACSWLDGPVNTYLKKTQQAAPFMLSQLRGASIWAATGVNADVASGRS